MRLNAAPLALLALLVPACVPVDSEREAGVNAPAPNFVHNDLEGREHELADYRGRVVVLDFWATWCKPCLESSPVVQDMHERYADRGVTVIAVHTRDPDGDPARYMAEHGYTYTVLPYADNVTDLYRITAFPTFIVIDRDGVVRHRQEGMRDGEAFIARIEALLPAG